MNREDIRKLLGGYATGTLTSEEQQALFEAALTDQELFDALAREQSLRDLLRDPAARSRILASIDEKRPRWYRRYWPSLAIAAAAAAGLAVAGVYLARQEPPNARPRVVVGPQVAPAQAEEPRPPAVSTPAVSTPAVRRPESAVKKVPVEPPPTPPAATPTPVVETSVSSGPGIQSGLVDAGSKAIPLQNAQALFFAQLPENVALEQDEKAPAQQQKRAARFQALPAALTGSARATNLGVKWTILRQRDGGGFLEVEPGDLRAGDSVKLRLIPNDNGFLSVTEADAEVLKATPVVRLKPFETPVIRGNQAGRKILTVQFTRTPAQSGLARNVIQQQSAIEQQSATDFREHATYVLAANPNPAAQVSVNIPLIFQ